MTSQLLSEPVLYRLFLARQWLQEGVEASTDPLPFGRMRALLALDDAVELAVITLLPLINERPEPGAALSAYLKQLAAAKEDLSVHVGPIERVRRLRNLIKHDGRTPSPEDARTAVQEVEAFLRQAILAVTGRELEEITPLGLLADEAARAELAAAQAALGQDDAEEACVGAAAAFARALARLSKRLSLPYRLTVEREALGPVFQRIGEAAEAAAHAEPSLQRFAREFRRALARRGPDPETLVRPTLLARFGIGAAELHRFEQVTPIVHVTLSGEARVVLGRRGQNPTRAEAAFAIDFVIQSLLRIEDWIRRNPRHLSADDS